MPWGDGFGPWWGRGRWGRWKGGWYGGWHHGRGYGPWWADSYGYPGSWTEYHDCYPSREEERAYLRVQAERLRKELERIEERLRDLD